MFPLNQYWILVSHNKNSTVRIKTPRLQLCPRKGIGGNPVLKMAGGTQTIPFDRDGWVRAGIVIGKRKTSLNFRNNFYHKFGENVAMAYGIYDIYAIFCLGVQGKKYWYITHL